MNRYLKAVKKRSLDTGKRIKNAYHALFTPHAGALGQYNTHSPNPQQMIDLFEGEWMSCFPSPYQHLRAGIYPLFDDDRLKWGIDQLGGVVGKKIIELGPLEGGHSFMLEQGGAASILAIEANPRAFMKCLITRQLMRLNRTDFLFGDFNAYLSSATEDFDLCVASGVLYHMKDPIKLLALIASRCQELFLWTQYYDPKICSHPSLRLKFGKPESKECCGFKHTLYPFKYGASRFWSTFIGGPARMSHWLGRQDIVDALRHFGFLHLEIAFEEQGGEHGPSFALIAKKNPIKLTG